jgi:N utilization substance protein A
LTPMVRWDSATAVNAEGRPAFLFAFELGLTAPRKTREIRKKTDMNNELSALLEYIEQERGIDRETMVHVLEEAMESAARKSVDLPADELNVEFDQDTCEYRVMAKLEVVESNPEKSQNRIELETAKSRYPNAKVGDVVDWEVTPENFGRIAAQAAKQAMMSKIRRVEKEIVNDEFKEFLGQIVHGVVRRYDAGNVVVDLGKAEGILSYKDKIPHESYMPGDRINALLVRIEPTGSGPSLILTRTNKDFVKRLFEREVSEIHDGIVEIKEIAREPGSRTKIAVLSNDERVDPIGACVGMRGTRVKSITSELGGEKIDIVEYSDDLKQFVANALQPAKLAGIEVIEDESTVDVTVDSDQLSLAIGKRGQNVRLTSKLIRMKVNISAAEAEEKVSFEDQITQAVDSLAEKLHLDKATIEKLVQNGFTSVDGLKEAGETDLAAIDVLTEEEVAAVLEALGKVEE